MGLSVALALISGATESLGRPGPQRAKIQISGPRFVHYDPYSNLNMRMFILGFPWPSPLFLGPRSVSPQIPGPRTFHSRAFHTPESFNPQRFTPQRFTPERFAPERFTQQERIRPAKEETALRRGERIRHAKEETARHPIK